MTRFVICIDIVNDDVAEAYGELYRLMAKLDKDPVCDGWESTDEAFNSNGDSLTPEEIQKASNKFFS